MKRKLDRSKSNDSHESYKSNNYDKDKYIKYFYRHLHKKIVKEPKYIEIMKIVQSNQNFVKEITESMSIIMAIRKLIINKMIDLDQRENYDIYVVGDGKRPYTALYLKLFFDMKNIKSIDPRMMMDYSKDVYDKFAIQIHKCKIENFVLQNQRDYNYEDYIYRDQNKINDIKNNINKTIVISVHGHGPIVEFYNKIEGDKIFISLPCCSDYGIINNKIPSFEYNDKYIHSPKNKILIYTDQK